MSDEAVSMAIAREDVLRLDHQHRSKVATGNAAASASLPQRLHNHPQIRLRLQSGFYPHS